ncbi:cytosine/adenosine deaminase-related metal-dependent hydrolase [Bacillus niacini]|uniref:Cytosine/adenosine deaminase-related metal-dependent hydrolase n=1 Tax=Neobacillus niacini TaxID=86668 RepID=A0A852TBQ4_9BACI|nr:amidohydrolase [Neobacillus niacini]NYE05641.1 cytosine/adenosine deaminase-related metal-dependent hydrolase [Neobacillus niacini]
MNRTYWLTNARLETGYIKENDRVAGTKTELFHLLIEDGNIEKIIKGSVPFGNDLPVKDAEGLLLLPSFIEKHVHLDKTYMGEDFRACIPASGVIERCEIEKNILASIPSSTQQRAEALLELLLSYGSTHVRTHVDIYPEVGLHNLEGVGHALETYSNRLSAEIVAFAQHGLLRPGTVQLVREAVRNGAGIVGAVDPATVDHNIEASLVQLMDLAVEGNADIDLHLHDPGHLGTFTMKRLAHLTKQAGWEGRVAVSHAFGLGDVSKEEAIEMAGILREAGISIVTSLPIGRIIPPVNILTDCGVDVAVGNDNIYDSWWPTGNGDVLERAGRLLERFRWTDEVSLGQTLKYITGGKTLLDKEGNQLWPKAGDVASMVLVEASCAAEAVARRAKRKIVIYKGNVVLE